jgi:two-component system chemotaxis response regulator CheV
MLEGMKGRSGDISEYCSLIITDIEMPIMDGHRLLRLVKEDSTLRKLPVIVFSSLITEENREIGESLGAVANISKPEIANLVGVIDANIL